MNEVSKLKGLLEVMGAYILREFTDFDGREVVFGARSLREALDLAKENSVTVSWFFDAETGRIHVIPLKKTEKSELQ